MNESIKSKVLAKAIPAYYAKHYLNLDTPVHQKRWYKYLDSRRQLILAPREHGKSEVFTRVNPEHHGLYIPDFRILLISKTYELSQAFLQVIEADLTLNEKIQRDFSKELKMYKKVGNKIWFNRYDPTIKEPTIEAIGYGGSVTSGHFDLVIMDDVIDDINTKTKGMREFISLWHQGTVGGLLAPEAKEHVVGTRKHPKDIYGSLMKSGVWGILEEKAIIKYPEYEYIKKKEDGREHIIGVNIEGEHKVLWDDPRCKYSWSIEKLLMKKAEMGMMFEREFQNNASIMEGALLKTEWLHFYTTDPAKARSDVILVPRGFVSTVQGWDFAIGQKDTNDYTVCCTLGIDTQNRCLAKFYRDRIDFPTAVAMVEARYLQETPTPRMVGMEANQFQKGYRQAVQKRLVIPTADIVQTTDKTMRILALSPYFQNGTIWIDIEDSDFFSEYTEFPAGSHDDMLDALEIAMQCVLPSITRALSTPRYGPKRHK